MNSGWKAGFSLVVEWLWQLFTEEYTFVHNYSFVPSFLLPSGCFTIPDLLRKIFFSHESLVTSQLVFLLMLFLVLLKELLLLQVYLANIPLIYFELAMLLLQ